MSLVARFFNVIITLIVFGIAYVLIASSYELLMNPDIDWISIAWVGIATIAFVCGVFLAFFGFKSVHEILKGFYEEPKSVKQEEVAN